MKVPNYTLSHTPHWNNECAHELKDYLFTVTFVIKGLPGGMGPAIEVTQIRDVYLWAHGNESDRTQLCIREGNDGPDYMSPPALGQFLLSLMHRPDEHSVTWRVVADAILNKCVLSARLTRKD
jgi:hypothetical protein